MSAATSPESSNVDTRAEHAIEKAEKMTRRAGEVARRAAQRLPASVVVVVGGTVLLISDAFGVGSVLTAGIAGYAAYRFLRRRAQKAAAAQGQAQAQP